MSTERGDVSAIVRIPALGENNAVPLLERTTDEVLAAGYGRFSDGAEPGDDGNFALAAHRALHRGMGAR